MGNYCRDWAEEASRKIQQKVCGHVLDSEYNPQIANAIPTIGMLYLMLKLLDAKMGRC